jgi:hypothetical protein
MSQSDILVAVAWGQYVHWCELQFRRFLELSEDALNDDHVGITAHWLAAEYVVLEGWQQLGHDDPKLNKLLSLYPENVAELRRCRNAVYHFQTEILDKRIVKCIADENEAMLWSIALHFEFQRYLLNYPCSFGGPLEEQEGLADEMAGCLGWWPTNTASAAVRRIYNKCIKLASIAIANQEDSPELASSTLQKVSSILQKVAELDTEPFTSKLSRWNSSDA